MLSGSLPIGLASRKGDSRKICHVEDNKLSGSQYETKAVSLRGGSCVACLCSTVCGPD